MLYEILYKNALGLYKTNKGKMPDLSGGKKSDFFFAPRDEPKDMIAEIVELCAKRLPR